MFAFNSHIRVQNVCLRICALIFRRQFSFLPTLYAFDSSSLLYEVTTP